MTTPKDKSQEGPYSAAWENGFCVVRDANAPEGSKIMMMVPDDMHWLAERLNAAYAAGRASQWVSVDKELTVAWMSDDEIDRICDDLSLGSRGRTSFRAGLRYARDVARLAHPPATEPVAWWNPVNDVALCKSEVKRRNGDKGACSIPLYRSQAAQATLTVDQIMEGVRKADKEWHDYYEEEFGSDLKDRLFTKAAQ